MTVALDEDAQVALRHLLEWRAMPAGSDKETTRRLEEQRSYAVEVCNAILRANPELAERLLARLEALGAA